MAKKKSGKATRAEKDLRAKVARLRRRLDAAEAAVDRWRGKAKKHKANASSAEVEIARLRTRLDKAAAPSPATSPVSSAGAPDDTWTLSALRTEAKRRQLKGYSRATKAQLITRLRRPDESAR